MALPIEACVPTVPIMADWIVGTHTDASSEAHETGSEWYALAHAFARSLTPKRVEIGAGVIAALSPQKSWSVNKRIARSCVRGSSRITEQTQANVAKAERILMGDDPLDVLGSDPRQRSLKALSFYKLILDPADAHTVCVDRHALAIATERERLLVNPDLPWVYQGFLNRKGAYQLVADAYRLAALECEALPHQVQAITWIAWRQSKRENHSTFTEAF